jgi:periplasmic protein TonB
MAGHIDILDQEDSLRQPFLGSLMVHLGVAALVAGAMFFQDTPFHMGDPNAQGGGSTVITPVSSIEMPSRTQRVQPVANDTESMVPERVKPIKPPPEDPNAIPLDRKKKDEPKKKVNFDLKKYLEARKEARDREPDPSNIGSSTGERASSPMFTQKPGAGGVGTPSGLLGEGFGAYEQYLRTCIARNWKTGDVDGGLRSAPDVTVAFRIPREGVASEIHVIKTSGNARLDNSGLRAIEACNPFNPLPTGFPKSSALIEIVFRLQR